MRGDKVAAAIHEPNLAENLGENSAKNPTANSSVNSNNCHSERSGSVAKNPTAENLSENSAEISKLESEINALVYQLYDLTADEIALIEN